MAPTIPPARILVVDDEPLVCATIKTLLGMDRHQVVAAGSSPEALALIEKGKFDLIIMDYVLPGMKGDQLAAVIKAQSPNQPIMMISGVVESLPLSDGKLAGVDLILGKPFTLEELREAVAKTLKV